jgi:hypothetical protein
MKLDYLSHKDYDDWRFGRVEYLEKVCKTNLNKLTFINKTIRKVAKDMQLDKSLTVYNQYGKGIKKRLRFSKTGNESIEIAYSTHYLDKNRFTELKQNNTSVQQAV